MVNYVPFVRTAQYNQLNSNHKNLKKTTGYDLLQSAVSFNIMQDGILSLLGWELPELKERALPPEEGRRKITVDRCVMLQVSYEHYSRGPTNKLCPLNSPYNSTRSPISALAELLFPNP